MTPRLDAELAALPTMSAAGLKAMWGRLVGAPVPRLSPGLLRLALAWELQARAMGGLPRGVTTVLDQRACGKTTTTSPAPGTRLVRAWQGRTHVVTIGEGGTIEWDGQRWSSLSEVARAITGTRWSGPAFFGLKTKAVPATAASRAERGKAA